VFVVVIEGGLLDPLNLKAVTELLELRAGNLATLLTKVTKVVHRTEGANSGLLVLAVVDELRERVYRNV